MIDVQSLIFIAVAERDLWAVDPPDRRHRRAATPDTYLAACAIYRDEARTCGVDRVPPARRGGAVLPLRQPSADDHREVLAPYVEDGIVSSRLAGATRGQIAAYDHCLKGTRRGSRWIAFIDLDEFLFSPTGRPLPEVLADTRSARRSACNWARSDVGTRHQAAGPGDRELLMRTVAATGTSRASCSPRAAVRCLSAHRFEYRHGLAVDENG